MGILRLSWDCGLATTCYSIGFHVPGSRVVMEFISNQTSVSSRWQRISKPRHSFPNGEYPRSVYLSPLHDSRDVSNLDEVIQYYNDALGINPVRSNVFPSGVRVAAFELPTASAFGHNVFSR